MEAFGGVHVLLIFAFPSIAGTGDAKEVAGVGVSDEQPTSLLNLRNNLSLRELRRFYSVSTQTGRAPEVIDTLLSIRQSIES